MIQASDVCRRYGTDSQQVAAVRDLNLHIGVGKRAAIIGKSGSGKSTLLNLLAGLDRPTSGTLAIDSLRLDQLTRDELAEYRLKTVGVIFQAFQLIPQRTALQNVELPLILQGVSRSSRLRTAGELLERVGLQKRFGHFPYQLSGGEQQRVAIARALVNSPKVILADEPTGNLDSVTADQILDLLNQVFRELQTTVVFVTHDNEIAERISDRQFRMSDGLLQEITGIKGISNGVQ